MKPLNKLITFVLTFLGSFIGQLYVRITRFDGSLDKWWLLVPPLSVPPLSVIPAYLIATNKIKKGEGGIPYDLYMLIPAIISILTDGILQNNKNLPSISKTIILFLVNFITIFLILYRRDRDTCINNKIRSNYEKFTLKNMNLIQLTNLQKEGEMILQKYYYLLRLLNKNDLNKLTTRFKPSYIKFINLVKIKSNDHTQINFLRTELKIFINQVELLKSKYPQSIQLTNLRKEGEIIFQKNDYFLKLLNKTEYNNLSSRFVPSYIKFNNLLKTNNNDKNQINFLRAELKTFTNQVELLKLKYPYQAQLPRSTQPKRPSQPSQPRTIQAPRSLQGPTQQSLKQPEIKNTKISYSKLFIQTAIIAGLLPIVPYLLRLVPYLGSVIEKVGKISPLMNFTTQALIKTICIIFLYTMINVINGRNIKKSCNLKYKMKYVVIVFVLSIIMNILIVTDSQNLIEYE